MINNEKLVMGENFFILKDKEIHKRFHFIEDLIFLSKMFDYNVVFSTSRKKMVLPSYKEKENDMIQFESKDTFKTMFYITLTYLNKDNSFHEIGFNIVDTKILSSIKEHEYYKELKASDYFCVSSNFNDLDKLLELAHIILLET